jgi:hypothetical protein
MALNLVGKVNPISSFGENCDLIVSDILVSKWLLGCAFHAPVTHAEDFPDLQNLDSGFSLTTSYQSISSIFLTDLGLCSHPHYVQHSTERMKPSSWLRSIIYRMDVSSHFH